MKKMDAVITIRSRTDPSSDVEAEGTLERTKEGVLVRFSCDGAEMTFLLSPKEFRLTRSGDVGYSAEFRAGETTFMKLSQGPDAVLSIRTSLLDVTSCGNSLFIHLIYLLTLGEPIPFELEICIRILSEVA